MDTVDAIYRRRAVRDFTQATPPKEEVEALIDAAIQAPSGMNRQPWCFVVAEGRARLERWSALANAAFADLAGHAAHSHPELARLGARSSNIFHGAPLLVVICATDHELMSIKDCCLAAENLMLAAEDRGLGSCWIGLAEAWLASPAGKAELGVPDAWLPVAPIILGRPTSIPPRPHRQPAAIHWLREVVAA